jgi:hypothetical protein
MTHHHIYELGIRYLQGWHLLRQSEGGSSTHTKPHGRPPSQVERTPHKLMAKQPKMLAKDDEEQQPPTTKHKQQQHGWHQAKHATHQQQLHIPTDTPTMYTTKTIATQAFLGIHAQQPNSATATSPPSLPPLDIHYKKPSPTSPSFALSHTPLPQNAQTC